MPIVLPTYPIRIQEANVVILRQADNYANWDERNREVTTAIRYRITTSPSNIQIHTPERISIKPLQQMESAAKMRYPKENARNRSMMAATCDRPVTGKPNIVNAIITLPARSLTPLRAYLP
jgi:hypothetical protein